MVSLIIKLLNIKDAYYDLLKLAILIKSLYTKLLIYS